MTKYLLNRLLRGLFSIVVVVAIVMTLIYSCLDRNQIFASDSNYSHLKSNAKEIYKMQQWEKYGYLDYVPYSDWLSSLLKSGEIDQDTYTSAVKFGDTAEDDSEIAAEYIARFTEEMEADGYDIGRLPAQKQGRKYKEGGNPRLYAYKDIPLISRLFDYVTNIFQVDNIHYVPEEADIGERGLTFTLYDPLYQNTETGEKKFSPAIIGNGTRYKYLLYFDNHFPYIHQNLLTVRLGSSYSISKDTDVFKIMSDTQGSRVISPITYPTGYSEASADNLHSATYSSGSLEAGGAFLKTRFTDDYTSVGTYKAGLSKVGYSFVIGIISVLLAYVLAIPIGTVMALKKDKLIDKLGTIYIIFIIAVPSLAYIFLFKAIGRSIGLPGTFDMENPTWIMYVLPIISLALPSIANLMKWLRRYMIDQMNSDYVKFARSGGLSEGEIFRKHILKNAIIPIVHGIPAGVLSALVGAIITERVYSVPGAGRLLTNAINAYDNGVIVGMTLFYALLSVVSIILGDILISLVDPRISFVSKKR